MTLGTYSVFRGLAEALTRGSITYTDFPASFLYLGQERWLGLPTQAWIFFAVAIVVGVLVHRTTFGRAFRTIGFSPKAPATPAYRSPAASPLPTCSPD